MMMDVQQQQQVYPGGMQSSTYAGQGSTSSVHSGYSHIPTGVGSSSPMNGSTVNFASGSLDGQKEISGPLGFVVSKLGPLKESAMVIAKQVKPWSQFLVLTKPSESADKLFVRVQKNANFFYGNYAVISVVMLLVFLLRAPTALIAIACLGSVWLWFVQKNEDVTWRPVVYGVELTKPQRYWAAVGISAVVFLMFAVDVLFSVIAYSLLVVIVHGIFNPGPTDEQLGLNDNRGLDQI